ncbi:MAG TPA: calcium/sodium antiporter [Acidobacteriota bacterium]|nr:calcium/sodium antiporter [Acidobacteriota bacterium]HNT17497.1 calcium/sodium antiporter [Acidobacteriota bacterium]
MAIFLFLSGLGLLVAGAECLVRGSSRLAASLGISPLIVGLTVVAFGTSSPELAVSLKAALSGQADIAVGNVVGSNILNVLLILGLSALIAPLSVSSRLVRLDVPLMILVSAAVLVFSIDGKIGRIDGAILVANFVLYCWILVRQGRRENGEIKEKYSRDLAGAGRGRIDTMKNIVLAAFGLGLLVVGSRLLVDGAVSFAKVLGVSESVIALTVVAAGTSLPEIVTSVIAAIRGERDIAVGNVVGSNLFNTMPVLGLSAIAAPRGLEVSAAMLRFDIPVMISVALACLPLFFTGGRICRKEGALLLGYYFAYTLYLVLASSHHDALPAFSAAMLYFAIPITAVTLTFYAAREVLSRSKDVLEREEKKDGDE